MQTLKTRFRALTAAVAIGALSVGFAPTANATATYDAMASFDLMLSSVTDANGDAVDNDWSVDAVGFIFDEDTLVAGIGTASNTTVIAPMTSLGIDDSV